MRRFTIALAAAVVLLAAACGIQDGWPRQVSFGMESEEAGARAKAIYSRDFVAGVDAEGVTHVQVFSSDTVVHTLPIDTVIDITADQRWLVQVETVDGDTLAVTVRVDVDDRNQVSRFGGIFSDQPWRYVYVFNQRITDELDVAF